MCLTENFGKLLLTNCFLFIIWNVHTAALRCVRHICFRLLNHRGVTIHHYIDLSIVIVVVLLAISQWSFKLSITIADSAFSYR